MRIVYFLPDIEAGVARVVRNLVKYRPESNIAYAVVLLRDQKQTDQEVTEPFNVETVYKLSYNTNRNLYAIYKEIAKFLKPDDIIVANDGFEIRMVVALKLPNPVVYILHGDFAYYYSICKLNQSVIDAFMAISKKIYQQLQNDLELANRSKVHQVYYPSAAVENRALSQKKSKTFKIVFAGNIENRKGAHLLPAIYNEISKSIPDFTFEIIGSGELDVTLANAFKDKQNVILTGRKPNEYVLQSLAESQVFLFPSLSEGLPNVLIEALSVGAVPVASFLESGVTDIIEHEKNGLLVETGNVRSFAAAIIQLYQQPEKLNKIKNSGKEILLKFEPVSQAKEYEDQILKAAKESVLNKREFPAYPMGGVLNKPWIPDRITQLIRQLIKHPKL